MLTFKVIALAEKVFLIVGSIKCMPNKNICYCAGCRSGDRKWNSMPGVGASEGVDDSVSVEDSLDNGPLGRTTQGGHLPTNEGGGLSSPQGKPSSEDENMLGSNKDGLAADYLFESIGGCNRRRIIICGQHVDVEENEVIGPRILFASCDSLVFANIARHFLPVFRVGVSYDY